MKVVPGEIAAALSRRLANCQIAVVAFEVDDTTRLALFVAGEQETPACLREIRRTCAETLPRHQMPGHIEILDVERGYLGSMVAPVFPVVFLSGERFLAITEKAWGSSVEIWGIQGAASVPWKVN